MMNTEKMDRTINKTRGTVNPRYDMTADELLALAEESRKDPVLALNKAFTYGYALGSRAARKEARATD